MAKLFVVLCVLVLGVSLQWVGVESQPYHNVRQLRNMVRLYRAVKNYFKDSVQQLSLTASPLSVSVTAARTALVDSTTASKDVPLAAWNTTQELMDRTGTTYISAGKAIAKHTLPDIKVHLTDVREDWGLGLSAVSPQSIKIMRSGVYLYELKVQTGDYDSGTFYMKVKDAAGDTKNSYAFWTDWEVAPHFKFLHLESGDTLTSEGFFENALKSVRLGTQFSMRYISSFRQHYIDYTLPVETTVAP